jgi:predicted dehydrogenase
MEQKSLEPIVNRPVEIIIVGAGNRGNIYATYALENPTKCRVVGVVEPNIERRTYFQEIHQLEDSQCFSDWSLVIERDGKLSDAVCICT